MKITQRLLLLLSVVSRVADASHPIALSGGKEVPPVSTDVTGTANFTLSEDGLSMDYDMTLLNPSGKELLGVAGAHVHCGGATEIGPVALSLAAPVATSSLEISFTGTLTVDDMTIVPGCSSDIAGFYTDILLARAYVNVHSSDNQSGEVRGQYDVKVVDVDLGGQNEVPMVTTDATGTATFMIAPLLVEAKLTILNPSGIDFYGDVGVHIHCGGIAVNGPVVVVLAAGAGITDELINSAITLTDANVISTECGATISEVMEKLKLGEAYVNAHSAENPSGEIRGTAINLGAAAFQLSGDFEVPPVDSSVTGTATFANATGLLKFELKIINPLQRAIFGAAGGHIHCGGPDMAGAVTAFLVAELEGGDTAMSIIKTGLLTDDDVTDVGCGATIDELTASVYEGTAYVNVHSPDFPSGATRGQVGNPASDSEPATSGTIVLTPGALGVISSLVALMVAI